MTQVRHPGSAGRTAKGERQTTRDAEISPPPVERIANWEQVSDEGWSVLQEGWRAWSLDELLCHPREAIKLCEIVRRRLNRTIPDHWICKALMRGRKSSRIPSPDRC